MKTKNKFLAILAIAVLSLISSYSMKGQIFTLTNNLPCGDVIIGYEIEDTPGSCNVCNSGQITITNGNSANLDLSLLSGCTPGAGFGLICIWLIEIDGVSVGTADCHNDCSSGTSCCGQTCFAGNTPAASTCNPAAPYNISVTPNASWLIF